MRSTDVLKNSNPIYSPNSQSLSGEARGLKAICVHIDGTARRKINSVPLKIFQWATEKGCNHRCHNFLYPGKLLISLMGFFLAVRS